MSGSDVAFLSFIQFIYCLLNWRPVVEFLSVMDVSGLLWKDMWNEIWFLLDVLILWILRGFEGFELFIIIAWQFSDVKVDLTMNSRIFGHKYKIFTISIYNSKIIEFLQTGCGLISLCWSIHLKLIDCNLIRWLDILKIMKTFVNK